MFRPLKIESNNHVYYARFVPVHKENVSVKYALTITNFINAWIEECEPRRLGPTFAAAKSDLISLFSKLFQYVPSSDIIKSESNPPKSTKLSPKFYLSSRIDSSDANSVPGSNELDLTVKFNYHSFPISYVFHLEPVPSPQEFIRDNIIKPLLFAVSQFPLHCKSENRNNTNNSQKAQVTSKTTVNITKELIEASNSPFNHIEGIGASLLEVYFKLQLDTSSHDSLQDEHREHQHEKHISQDSVNNIDEIHDRASDWKYEEIAGNSAQLFDLTYDHSSSIANGNDTQTHLNSQIESLGSHSSASPASTLPNSQLWSQEAKFKDEMLNAEAIKELINKKKRKREEKQDMEKSKKIRKFL